MLARIIIYYYDKHLPEVVLLHKYYREFSWVQYIVRLSCLQSLHRSVSARIILTENVLGVRTTIDPGQQVCWARAWLAQNGYIRP